MSFSLFSPMVIASVGMVGAVIIVIQMLIGYRKIKFKGRTHMKVHRGIAWAIVGVTTIHGALAITWIIRLAG